MAEQKRIVAIVEKYVSKVQEVEASVRGALNNIELLEQSLLKQSFEGKLVPQDHDDEPVSGLLERIRVQRATIGDKRKPPRALEFASPATITPKA